MMRATPQLSVLQQFFCASGTCVTRRLQCMPVQETEGICLCRDRKSLCECRLVTMPRLIRVGHALAWKEYLLTMQNTLALACILDARELPYCYAVKRRVPLLQRWLGCFCRFVLDASAASMDAPPRSLHRADPAGGMRGTCACILPSTLASNPIPCRLLSWGPAHHLQPDAL